MDSIHAEEKSSRYLREIDRRNILARIERGEKQSALAKEFRVTRAAICNLNKQRDQIMTRECDDPLSKHPKRAKSGDGTNGGGERDRDENSSAHVENRGSPDTTGERKMPWSQLDEDQVYLVESRAAAMLSELMRDRNVSELSFQYHSARLMVYLIEEAVAWMYTRRQQSIGKFEDDRESSHFMLDDYYTRRPPCGVTVDEFGPLFLDKFRSIDPTWRCGVIEFADATVVDAIRDHPVRMDLPRALPACNVFVLLSFAHDGDSRRLHQSVRILIDHGVVEELLCLVALGITSRVVHLLHAEFPRLRVATASLKRETVDSRGDSRSAQHPSGVEAITGSAARLDAQEERAPIERLSKLDVSSG